MTVVDIPDEEELFGLAAEELFGIVAEFECSDEPAMRLVMVVLHELGNRSGYSHQIEDHLTDDPASYVEMLGLMRAAVRAEMKNQREMSEESE